MVRIDSTARIVAVVQIPDDLSVSRGLVRADRDRTVEPHAVDGLLREGFGGFRVPPGGQPHIDELASMIHGAPEVTSLAANAQIGLVDMPVQPAPAAVGSGAPGDLGAELLDRAEDRGPVHHDPALGQEIGDILGREWKPAVPAHGQQDNASREPAAPERIAALGALPVPRLSDQPPPRVTSNATVPPLPRRYDPPPRGGRKGGSAPTALIRKSFLDCVGAPRRTRTADHLFTKQVLYQLSYWGLAAPV